MKQIKHTNLISLRYKIKFMNIYVMNVSLKAFWNSTAATNFNCQLPKTAYYLCRDISYGEHASIAWFPK